MWYRSTLMALLAASGAAVITMVAAAADPDALWKIVHDNCVPGARAGNPTPCIQVDTETAVLKDRVGATQFLLIPTARITGIESPAVLAPGAPNLFAAAWRARRYVEERAGHDLPRDGIVLAINPPSARSQEQLHIHVDCIRPDIRDALRTLPIGTAWGMLPIPLAGQRYAAMRLPGDALDRDPFAVLADGLPGARADMGQYTLVVTGSVTPETGFILLAGRVGDGGVAHGEDLQDHRCIIADAAR